MRTYSAREIGSDISTPDRSGEFRKAAADCLALVRVKTDPEARVSLLVMAQRWFDLANGSPSAGALDAALKEFNDRQLIGPVGRSGRAD
jgi:hypothetical protein